MNNYDYLVVGAGLFGATFAYEAAKRGKRVKVIEKRDHIAGNIYTKEVDGIQVYQYGAHIFHTSDQKIWNYVNRFAEFNRYTNSPVANYKGQMYNLPFNMGSMIFGKDKMNSYLYRFLLLAVPVKGGYKM